MNPALPLIVIGGGAFAYAKFNEAAPALPPGPPQYPPSSGVTVGQAINPVPTPAYPAGEIVGGKYYPNGYKTGGKPKAQAIAGTAAAHVGIGFSGGSSQSTDPATQAKLDAIKAAIKKTYDDMNEVAKAKAAEALNKELKLNPPLTGHESWAETSAAVAGVAGAAVGTALCGPVCGALGSMAAAYLGAKLGDLLSKHWDELTDWLDSEVWGGIKDVASDIGDAAEDLYDDFVDLF